MTARAPHTLVPPAQPLVFALAETSRRLRSATVERDNVIRQMARAGYPLREIAALAGLSHGTVANIVSRLHLPPRRMSQLNWRGHRPTDEQTCACGEIYRDGGDFADHLCDVAIRTGEPSAGRPARQLAGQAFGS